MSDVLDRLRAANPVPRDLSTGWSTSAEGEATRDEIERKAPAVRRRHGRPWAAAVAAVLVLGVVASVAVLRDGSGPAPTAPRSTAIERLARGQWASLPDLPAGLSGDEIVPIWTGRQLIVWSTDRGAEFIDHEWQRLPDSPVDAYGTAVRWTGSEMIVLGGVDARRDVAYVSGSAYNPKTRQWRRIAASPFLAKSGVSTATWTGRVLVVTSHATGEQQIAASYEPRADRWQRLPDLPAELFGEARVRAAWDGERVVYTYNNGGAGAAFALDPARGTWDGLHRSPSAGEEVFSDLFRWRDDVVQVAWLGSSLQTTRLPSSHSFRWEVRRRFPYTSLCEVRTFVVPGGAVVQCSRAPGLAYAVGVHRWFDLPPTAGRHFKITSMVWTGRALVATSLDGQVRELS